MNLEKLIQFFIDITQIAGNRVETVKDLETLLIRTYQTFLLVENPLEIDEFLILEILGNVGG